MPAKKTRAANMELCSVCSQLEPPPLFREQLLGPYDELLLKSQSLGPGRAGCGGCVFFSEIIRSSERWCDRISELSDHIIAMDNFGKLITRASPGSKDRSELRDNDLLLAACTEEGATDFDLSDTGRMRRVPADPRESNCFDLISQLIIGCSLHRGCSAPAPVALPQRIIEISPNLSVPPKLRITNGALGQYVILSHCWGTRKMMKLTNALLSQYQEAIKLELLPNSFKDAIEIARQLGFQNLWIDALCIIQDDTEDWAREAGKMASYYGLSTLMISATAAKDSSEGILTARNVPYSPILGQEKKYHLFQRSLHSHTDIDQSVLATRGWCAQERMLAPRILHFTRRQVIWECAEEIWYEAFDIAETCRLGVEKYVKSLSQHLVTEALSQENAVPYYHNHDVKKVLRRTVKHDPLERIYTWERCVNNYSSRFLTVPTDKVPAIAGIARMLNHRGELGSYLAGIWSAHLAAGLAWTKWKRKLSSPLAYTAPSWSWAGMEGEVNCVFIMAQTISDDAENIYAEMFDPKLIDQHMVLQDEQNVYGAVLEGSYIIVEAVCLTHVDFRCLMQETYGNVSGDWMIRLDKVDDEEDDLDLSDRRDEKNLTREAETAKAQHMHVPAPYDCCMFLIRNLSYNKEEDEDEFYSEFRCIDFLLLSWVDRGASVAERVGTARMMPEWSDKDGVQFLHILEAANWERRTLKLV